MGTSPDGGLRDVYERRAELEYAAPRPLPQPRVDRKFARILELVRTLLPRERVLDAGCGDGRYLEALAQLPERPARLVGSDLAARILETARERTADVAGVELVRAELEALPFEDGSFDLVLCTQVIEHLLEPLAGLRELARVLAPGGALVISTDNERALVTRALNAPRSAAVRALRLRPRKVQVEFPHASFRVDDFVRLVRETGLEVEHAETFRFHLQWPLDRPVALRLLNRLDERLPPHGFGDIVAVVAAKR